MTPRRAIPLIEFSDMEASTKLVPICTAQVQRSQRDRFTSGELWAQWARDYPSIFDQDDVRLARSQAHLGYHFYEWLAAVLLYHSCGYLSLVEQYQFKNHRRKHELLQRLVLPSVLEFISDRTAHGGVQCPDLLVYKPDLSDWFFCEVKGPGDKLSLQQEEYFGELAQQSGRQIRLVRFRMQRD